MAIGIGYTDVALAQIQGNNYPGEIGQSVMLPVGGVQNNPAFELPPEIIGTYVMTGNEAAGDIINIAMLPQGVVVDPNGKVATGVVAPATTLTCSIGDNDLGLASGLPVPNVAAIQSQPSGYQAPTWVTGTSYVPGNVVLDPAATPANSAFTCISATSGATAPNAAATTVWMPNLSRYSASINIAGASANVAFAGGTQNYGGPASRLPNSCIPGAVQIGYTTAQLLAQQYQIQGDCWLQAKLLTVTTPVANTQLVFRAFIISAN